MVQVSVTAAVKVAGGPVLPLTWDMKAKSYAVSSSKLEKAGDPKDKDTLPLPDGEIALLAVTVVNAKGGPADAKVTLNGTDALTISGSLVVANEDAVARLIPTAADRTAQVENDGTEPVWVEILVCQSA